MGTHLHPWTTPPWTSPYDDHPTYPSELPLELLEQKLGALTDEIAERFGKRPTAYKAGRFGFDGRTLKVLEKLGYTADGSVTPYVSWRKYPGLPGGPGGPDFLRAPLHPYHPDYGDPCRPGKSRIVEVPVSIAWSPWVPSTVDGFLRKLEEDDTAYVWLNRSRVARRSWFYPTLGTARRLVSVCESVMRMGVPVFHMMIHSSELAAGKSPYYPTEKSIDDLYDRMDKTFERVFSRWQPDPVTLTEAGQHFFPVGNA